MTKKEDKFMTEIRELIDDDIDNVIFTDDVLNEQFWEMFASKDNLYGIVSPIKDTEYDVLKKIKPKTIDELVCSYGIILGDSDMLFFDSKYKMWNKLKKDRWSLTNIEDLRDYFVAHGISKTKASKIAEFVGKGSPFNFRYGKMFSSKIKNHDELAREWNSYKDLLHKHKVNMNFINFCEQMQKMEHKEVARKVAFDKIKRAWLKLYYPEEFYKAYFKTEADINVKAYYNRAQIQRKLNRCYDKMEVFEFNPSKRVGELKTRKEIADLKLLYDAFDFGYFKEIQEINDDYNWINSRAIADYCREINHKFDTEELAVLVCRNKRRDIHQKIAKYKDLIDNYPDMEVKKRINCEHYDSVKVMIKEEIARLEKNYNNFIKDDGNSIYSWDKCSKSTKEWGRYDEFESITKNYEEVLKNIQDGINKFDDTDYVEIVKKSFESNTIIRAYFCVINKKLYMYDIGRDKNDDWTDINQIFINIPTPFEKGDILTYMNPSGDYNNNGDIFVLSDLITWYDKLETGLKNGGFDSSDMNGYGYYFYGKSGFNITHDHKCDYDNFDYYDGKLEYKNRFLKTISSLLKGKIDIGLFLGAYEKMKQEEGDSLFGCTYEGYKLCGFNDLDIKKIWLTDEE